MFYVLWAIINIALDIYFLYVVFLVGKVLAKKIGGFAAVFFLVALLSVGGHSGANADDDIDAVTGMVKHWNFTPQDSLLKGYSASTGDVYVKTTPLAKFSFNALYGMDKVTRKHVPINAYASLVGTSIGTHWKANYINVNATDDDTKFEYQMGATTEWYLMGFLVYTGTDDYHGVVKLK